MCTQQEKKFKEELHEKEQEIVRLHTILRSTEMHMHEHRAASAAKEVELSVLRARLDQVTELAIAHSTTLTRCQNALACLILSSLARLCMVLLEPCAFT